MSAPSRGRVSCLWGMISAPPAVAPREIHEAPLKHAIPHDLEHELARQAARAALRSYQAAFSQYQPRGEWVDEDNATVAFTVMGGTIEGGVRVTASTVELELSNVPFMFRPFRSQAIEIIEGELRGWIEKARNGQL